MDENLHNQLNLPADFAVLARLDDEPAAVMLRSCLIHAGIDAILLHDLGSHVLAVQKDDLEEARILLARLGFAAGG